VDGLVILFIVVQAILLAFAIGVAVARGRALDDIRGATETRTTGPDLGGRIRRLIEETDTAALELDGARRDLSYLIELIGIGIVRLGDDRRIELANAAAHAFLDRAAGSLRGLTLTGAFLDARIESIVETAHETGSQTGEVRLRPDGAVLVVRARRSPVRGLWLVLEDVSELRRLQQIRAEFIENLSHELRTPLTTVSLLAETLTREAETAGDAIPAKMRDRIAKIEVETGHLVQMVNELLDLSRIETGVGPILLDDVDLVRIAVASTERLRLFADRQGVTLATEVAEDVPMVRGDEARLGQVLVNLLHNAVKFSPDGGDVTVSVHAYGSDVLTSVADHGVGVPKAAQARIFERFYKVDRARVRGEAGGTGLGLAIARHVIEQHGGRIWVESVEGQGSTFSFALPIPPTQT
jgi:two-component system, OmpR family, phosphate regulon sensor histidine kinase PhoR